MTFPPTRSSPGWREEHLPALVARAPPAAPAVLLPHLDRAGQGLHTRLPQPHDPQLLLRADVRPGTEKCRGVRDAGDPEGSGGSQL